MGVSQSEGIPWQPQRIDELLDEPFERIEEHRADAVLSRLDELDRQLDLIERDLDTLLETAPCS
jgi:hypothetical protein